MHRLPIVAALAVASTAVAEPSREPRPRDDAELVAAIRTAARAFTTWHRVDERPNIAPLLCRAPTPEDYGAPSHVRRSGADAAPHGKKLYYLWASAGDTYAQLGKAERDPQIATGFAIVKQSFTAKPIARTAATPAPKLALARQLGEIPPPITWLDVGDERLAIDRPKDLFVMVKLGDASDPRTDAGWIYGTVAPDGTVTSAGRVATCMHCHERAAHDRLFGLQR